VRLNRPEFDRHDAHRERSGSCDSDGEKDALAVKATVARITGAKQWTNSPMKAPGKEKTAAPLVILDLTSTGNLLSLCENRNSFP
jgi:hypothetical protein